MTIDGSEFSVFVSPLVPDAYTMLLQVFHVRVAFQEPQQFVDDRLQMEFLGGEQRESVVEVVTALGAEDADGSCTCTVTFLSAFCQDTIEDV